MVETSSVIFLDIDGVLLPQAFARFQEQLAALSRNEAAAGDEWMEHFAPYSVANLRTLVQSTGSGIVLSSNRRTELPLPDWQAMWMARGLPGVVLGYTPQLPAAPGSRGREVAAWLAAHPAVRFVILDDMPPSEFEGEQQPCVVQCDERLGLTSSVLTQALALLQPAASTHAFKVH